MPGAVTEAGLADTVLPLADIGRHISGLLDRALLPGVAKV
jgi:chemotaxis response regulator CheB